MKPIRYIIPLAACAGALAAGAAGLSGCLDSQAYAQVGAAEPNAASFQLQNGLGKSITSIEVKASSAKEYGDALAQAAPIADGETVEFSYAPQSDESDLRIETDDGTRYVLHDVNLADVEDATLKAEGQTGYLDYTSTKLGSEKTTLAGEKDLEIAELKASQKKQQAEIDKLTAAKEKAEAEKKAEAKKRKAAEKEAKALKSAGTETTESDEVSVTTGGSTASSAGSSASGSSSSTSSSSSGSSKKTSSSAKSKSSSSSSSKKKSSSSSSSGSSSSSAAQKAAEANGNTSEQQCTKDF